MTGKKQHHKRMEEAQVRSILEKFNARELTGVDAARLLGIGRTRLYQLQKDQAAGTFSLEYHRDNTERKISSGVQKKILSLLKKQKQEIADPAIPLYRYNYSYAKDRLEQVEGICVSVMTVSRLAHQHGYVARRKKKKEHTGEVVTNCIGELVKHDSSVHQFAPYSNSKWHLVSSIDDCSRVLLHARFYTTESAYAHIQAFESICLQYGIPHACYSDNHRIFRYVKSRDEKTPWTHYTKFTDDVQTQWKGVLNDLMVKTIYASSPQAKGKIERPYGWIQDRLVRRCIDEEVKAIVECQVVLDEEIQQ